MERLFCIIAVVLIVIGVPLSAPADNLKKVFTIARHGERFQLERLKIVAENIANEGSTRVTLGADAYRRKVTLAENRYDKKLGTNVIKIKKADVDNSEFIMKFDPYHHTTANAEGYVKYSNITREIERADAAEAQRGYESNLSIWNL